MTIDKRIKLLKKQLGDKLYETLIHFYLSSGKEKIGIIEDIGEDYIIIQTLGGLITIFELDGWEIENKPNIELKNLLLAKTMQSEESSKQLTKAETESFIDGESIDLINKFIKKFSINNLNTDLDIKPPELPIPKTLLNLDQNKRTEIKRSWDKIISKYHYYIKTRKFSSLRILADDILGFGRDLPSQEVFLYNAGCFQFESENYKRALRNFLEAYKLKKKKEIIFNVACSALKINNYDLAYKAILKYYKFVPPISDIRSWYAFCSLINQIQDYNGLKEIYNNIIQNRKNNKINILASYKLEGDHDNDFILLCRTIVFFLKSKNKLYDALKIINYLETDAKDEIEERLINKVHSLIDYSVKILSQSDLPGLKISFDKKEEEKFLKEYDSKIIKKKLATPVFSKGLILNFFRNKGYGFIYDDNDEKTYFFHISNIIDDELINILKNDKPNNEIYVYFEKSTSPRGLVAIKISLYRSIKEIYDIAIKQANEGEYTIALTQIEIIINLDPNYSDANELRLRWREYSREASRLKNIPKGTNPYARAKRVELIEKDLKKAERFLREAIQINDNYESATKDLAQILNRLKRPNEAIELLEKNRSKIRNKKSIDYILTNLYRKIERFDKAASLLMDLIKKSGDKEEKAKLLYQIGHIHLKQENYLKAQDSFEELLVIYPQNLDAKRSLAICLYKQKQFSAAENILEEILDESLDNKAAELLEAISNAKKSGLTRYVDDLITEISASEFSLIESKFTQFYIDNCNFDGVPPENTKILDDGRRIYIGTKNTKRFDLQSLMDLIKTLGELRPREGANYFLSAARISMDTKGEPSQFYRFLSRSFALRGDTAVINKQPVDTARTWYIESLILYDKIRNILKEEKEVIYSIIRFLYSILGISKIPKPPKVPSIETAIIDIFNNHNKKEKIFNAIGYLSLNSQFATTKILQILYNNPKIRKFSLDYFESRRISISTSKIDLEEFINLWNELNRLTFNKIRSVVRVLQTLTRIEMATAWLEDAIERIKPLSQKDRLFFLLDQRRVLRLQEILEESLELCKKNTFEDRERLIIQINQSCLTFLNEIKENPTKLSIEEIFPILEIIREEIQHDLDDLYEQSVPHLTLRLPTLLDSYTPDLNQEISVQIVVENKDGCSPAESLELRLMEGKKFFKVKKPTIKLDESLRGGDQRIISVPLKIYRKAIESRTFSLSVYAQYRSRLNESNQTEVINFSINLYPEKEFEVIKNPHASYAEGGIVDNPKMFYGRDELIENIKQTLMMSSAQNKCVIIFGQKRSGKSSILYHLKKRLKNEKDVLILDLKNIGVLLDEHSSIPLLYQILWCIIESLIKQIQKRIQKGYSSLDLTFPDDLNFYNHPTPIKYLINIFDTYMSQTYKKKDWKNTRIVLMIDEFSYIYSQIIKGKISEDFMKNWKGILQRNYFNVVLAGQDIMEKFKQRFPNEFGTTQDERISYLRRKHARDLIDNPIRIPPFTVDGESRYREKAIDRIIDLTAGSPFYIQIICNRLVEYMNRYRIKYITEANIEIVKNELLKGVNAFKIDKFDNLINSADISEDAINDEDIITVLKSIANNSKTGPCTRASIKCETTSPIDMIIEDLIRRDVIKRVSGNLYNIKVGLFKEWLNANL